MNKFVWIGLLALSGLSLGYWFFTKEFNPDLMWWGRTVVAGVAGAGGLGYELLKGKLNKGSEQVFRPKSFEQQDFDCLIHLRNRVTEANDQAGIETVQKLNSIIFALHRKEQNAT